MVVRFGGIFVVLYRGYFFLARPLGRGGRRKRVRDVGRGIGGEKTGEMERLLTISFEL